MYVTIRYRLKRGKVGGPTDLVITGFPEYVLALEHIHTKTHT